MHLGTLVNEGSCQISDLGVTERTPSYPVPWFSSSFLNTPLLILEPWDLGGGRVSGETVLMVFDGELLRNHT